MKCVAVLIALCASCSFPDLRDADDPRRVAGAVDGLWTGSDGVVVRLQAGGAQYDLTLTRDGEFRFDDQLAIGTSYSVVIDRNPIKHACAILDGASGTITGQPLTAVSIHCEGPAFELAITGRTEWAFDRALAAQTFASSILTSAATFRLTGDATGLTLNGEPAGPFASTTVPVSVGSSVIALEVFSEPGLSRTYELTFDRGGVAPEQIIYAKPSIARGGDEFGISVAYFGDLVAVGAWEQGASDAGTVYVFQRAGTTWTQQAILRATNANTGDLFGCDVAIGNTPSGPYIAVGARNEASSARTINGNAADNTAPGAGAVYIFTRNATTWTQSAYLKASNADAGDLFGTAVAASESTVVVGSYEDSGVVGNPADNTAGSAGAVYVFVRSSAGTWTQEAYLKAANVDAGDGFGGESDRLAIDGDTIAVAAASESSDGVTPSSNALAGSGAAYVFVRSGTTWTQQAMLKAANAGEGDQFGISLALAGDRIAVGAPLENGAGIGVSPASNEGASRAGAAYVFRRTGTTWEQELYVKATNTGPGDNFGFTIGLTDDVLAVGAWEEDSDTDGWNGNGVDNSAPGAGAAYLYTRTGDTWATHGYLKSNHSKQVARFGTRTLLAPDGLIVTAGGDSSNAAGINGNEEDTSAPQAGGVFAFR